MSKKILIVGATGSIGNKLRKTLLEKTDYELTLFSTGAGSLIQEKINADVFRIEPVKQYNTSNH